MERTLTSAENNSNSPANQRDAKFLTPMELDLVIFIESYHGLTGLAPEEHSMIDYLHQLGYSCSAKELDAIKANPLFIKSMDSRGIIIGADYVKNKKLTPRQMLAASTLTNYVDRRSDEKKLRDLGISTAEYSTWMQDRVFVEYMTGRAERLLSNSTHEAHMGLIRGVRQGNVASIKLFYEITDRYNPEKDNQVNIKVLLGRVVEIIQTHVKDPETLTKLAGSLQQLAIETLPTGTASTSSPVAKSVIRGEVER